MIDITPIIEAIIALLAAIITAKLIPWIKAKTTNEQQIKIEAAVRTAVFAAEQIYGAGRGSEKLSYAVNYMRSHGYEVDVSQIEAAVNMHMNTFKQIPVVTEAEAPAEE